MTGIAIVFVHGLFSSGRTWDAFRDLIEADQELAEVDLLDFEYPSPKFRLSPLKSIPDFNVLADSLQTFLETLAHSNVILVSHSQGGLIVQRYLARMVMGARGRELVRIRRVVMFACPNSGSEIFLTLRRAGLLRWQSQERQLHPLDDSVGEAQRVVANRVIHARSVSTDQCPVEIRAYAGEEDNVVTPASARGVFPRTGVLPGDHFSIIQPDSADHRAYLTLKANIRDVLRSAVSTVYRSSEIRDYIYVSARKVGRIGRSIRPDIWARMESNSPASGPFYAFSPERIAASVESKAEDVIALVSEVEELLDQQYGLKGLTDKDLDVGHWFRLHNIPMIYGVPGMDIGGAIFIGQAAEIRFALGGSAEYLLDRPAQHLIGGPWGYSASGLRGVRDLLEKLAMIDREGGGGSGDTMGSLKRIIDGRIDLGRGYDQVAEGFGSNWEPMTAVARCLQVSSATDGSRAVLGTPLYVAFYVPE